MSNSWLVRIAGVVILVIGIAAIGYFAYTAGQAQGQTAAPIVAGGAEEIETWHAPMGLHAFRGMAFFPGLLCLAPFFLCLFIFLPFRMIFGPNHMRMHMRGKWFGEGCDDVPHPVEEWHRRMHETKKKDE